MEARSDPECNDTHIPWGLVRMRTLVQQVWAAGSGDLSPVHSPPLVKLSQSGHQEAVRRAHGAETQALQLPREQMPTPHHGGSGRPLSQTPPPLAPGNGPLRAPSHLAEG